MSSPPPDICVPCEDKQLVCMGNVAGQWTLLTDWKHSREQKGNPLPRNVRHWINKARNDVLKRKGEAATIIGFYDQELAGRIRAAGIIDGFTLLKTSVPGMTSEHHHQVIETGEDAELDIRECFESSLSEVGWVDPEQPS
jgi:hypothetical protein